MLKQATQALLLTFLAAFGVGSAAFGEDGQSAINLYSATQAQGRFSLKEVQAIALKQNPEVLQANLEVNKSTAHLKSIMTERYPKLLAITFIGQQVTSAEGKYFQNLAVLPAVLQPLTQQYRLGLQVRQANFLVQISQQRLRLAKQQTVAEVKKTYLSMLALQSSIVNLTDNLAFLSELARFVRSEVRRGAALPVDDLLVQAQVAKADFELDRSKDNLITMGQNLNRMLGRPVRSEIILLDEVVAPFADTNESADIDSALLKRPELSEVKLDIKRSRLEKRVELSRYIPDVSLAFTGIFSKKLDITLPQSFGSAGFLLNWEPWDWGRRIQISLESENKMRQDTIRLKDLSEGVSISVDKARRDFKVAEKEAKAGELAVLSTKEQLRVVHRRFTSGAALLKDDLEAQSAFTKAIAENVKAKTDIAIAQVELDKALGRDF